MNSEIYNFLILYPAITVFWYYNSAKIMEMFERNNYIGVSGNYEIIGSMKQTINAEFKTFFVAKR